MADAMLHKEKGDKTPKSSFEDDLLRLDEDEIAYEGKGKGPAKGPAKRKCSKPIVSKSTGSGPKVNNKDAKGKTLVNKGHEVSASTSDSNNNVIINMLTDMRNEQSSTNKKLEDMNKRIDVLYNDEYDDEYDNVGDVDEDMDEVHEPDDGQDTGNEPPCKKQKTVSNSEESRFSSMNKRFRSGEKCGDKLDEHLADNITDIFRNGISEEKYRELMKDEKSNRPENCEGLVPVQTDQLVWDLLWPRTRTNDNRMRQCQTSVVRGATYLSKVVNRLDTILSKEDTQNKPELEGILDDCMDSLALFGHANKEICLARRELMKPDVKGEYSHLFNKSQPFNKWLFGGDVSKTVKDIGECSKISNRLSVGNGYSQFRGGFRGGWRSSWNRRRGRGRGGRGRGSASRSIDKSESKNSRWTHNKYRN
ncbi:uncharacterized protein LOC134693025 [Mytilus trossulus]|uniref:uncharacterized protein LOC134693025 n=1 Tax=Mytilus trossulus TaxID=6551 RepID=UPI0030046774